MNLEEDIAYIWRLYPDKKILSDIKKAIRQDWPPCGGVSVERQMVLLREAKIRITATNGERDLVCIDAEPGWERFSIPNLINETKFLSFGIVISNTSELISEFNVKKHRGNGYTEHRFDSTGKYLGAMF